MGNSGGLRNNNVFQPFHYIFQPYPIEEVGRKQRFGAVVRKGFQKWPLLLRALQEMTRSEWCPALPQLHIQENQDHGYGSRALKPQLSAATLHQFTTH